MNKVRWGILGAGRIANTFVKDFAMVENAEIIAVAARDKVKAREFAAQYKIPEGCSYEELYAHKNIDIIYISTTHNFHYEHIRNCLENGKAVLCEKPITVNDNELEKLIALAKEKKLFLMEAMWTWFLPAIKKAKQWINEERIGTLKLVEADFCFNPEFNPEKRLFNINLAGGALLDIGVYLAAISTFFTEQYPRSITSSAVLGRTGVDENTSFILQYEGITAHLLCSIIVKTTSTLYLFGEKGYIRIPLFWRADLAELYDTENRLLDHFKDQRTTNGFDFEIQNATDCIAGGRTESAVVPLRKSLDIQKIMTTVRKQIGLKYPFE